MTADITRSPEADVPAADPTEGHPASPAVGLAPTPGERPGEVTDLEASTGRQGPNRRRWIWGCCGLLLLLAICGLCSLLVVTLSMQRADIATERRDPAAAPGGVAATPLAGQTPSAAADDPDGPRRGGTLRLAGAQPSTLDPALVRDVNSAGYMVEIYSGLVTLSPQLEVIPDLAERWDLSEDGRRYTFYLREGLTFHDGSPLTSDAVVFGIERACDPATGSTVAPVYLGDIVGCQEKLAGERQTVTGLQNPDERTVIIDIDAPKAYFLAKLSYPTAFALDPLQVERDPDWAERPNGSGPFRLVEWVEDERLILERHPGFLGEGPYLDQVHFDLRPIATETRFEAGELDAIGVGSSDMPRVSDPLNPLSDLLLVGEGELGLSYMAFDTRVPPFDDQKLRQAFNLAVDKERLARVLLDDTAVPVWGLLPPGLAGFDPDLSPYRFDPEAARAAMAASAYPRPADLPPITLYTSGGGGDPLLAAVVDSINEVLGLDIQIEQADWELFEQELTAGRYPFFALGWSADYPDPQDFLDVLLHSGSALNHGGYANAAADALLEEARVAVDKARRLDLYQQAERLILEDAPWVPLFTGREAWLVAPQVRGFGISPIVVPRLQRIWLADGSPR